MSCLHFVCITPFYIRSLPVPDDAIHICEISVYKGTCVYIVPAHAWYLQVSTHMYLHIYMHVCACINQQDVVKFDFHNSFHLFSHPSFHNISITFWHYCLKLMCPLSFDWLTSLTLHTVRCVHCWLGLTPLDTGTYMYVHMHVYISPTRCELLQLPYKTTYTCVMLCFC